MSDDHSAVVDKINDLAEQRFALEVKRSRLVQTLKDREAQLKAEFGPKLAAIQEDIDRLDPLLYGQIEANRSSLIARGRQSFVTLAAKFQFKKPSGTDKVTDVPAVMDVARRLRVVKQVADPIREYKFNRRRFAAWLKKNPELRSHFEDYLESGVESLTIQPNNGYMVYHDSERISPPSVSIKKS